MVLKRQMKKSKKLIVCIPCFNAGKYIARTLESLMSSSYKDFDVYIFDNASIDNSVEIINSFVKKYNNIHLYRNKKNIGMFPNMNKCLSVASGKYLKILCADDILYKNCLLEQVNILDRFDDVVLVYGSSNVLTNKFKRIMVRKHYKYSKKVNGGVLINKILLSGRNPLGEPTGVTLRTSVIKRNKLFFESAFKYISDMDLWIKILQYGNGYFCRNIQFGFCLHKGQGTILFFKKALKEHILLFRKYKDEYDLSNFEQFLLYLRLIINYFGKLFILFSIK